MSIGWILFEIGLNGFDAAYVISLSSDKKSFKSWVRRYHIVLFWIALVTVYCVINFFTDFSFLSIFVFPTLAMIYPILFHSKNILKQVLYLLFLYTLLICIELLVASIFINFYQTPLEVIASNDGYRLPVAIISKSLDSVVWIYFFMQNQKGKMSIQKIFNAFIVAILAFAFSLSMLDQIAISGIHKAILPLTFLFLLVCTLLFLKDINTKQMLDRKIQAEKEAQIQLEYYEKETQMQIAYCEKVVDSYQKAKDFQNSILANLQDAWIALREARYGNTNYITKQLNAMRLINEQLHKQSRTGNSLIDMVLLIKDFEFISKQVVLKVEGELPEVHSTEVSMIVDHLLSKAFEETTKADPKEYCFPFVITIRFEQFGTKGLMIEVEYVGKSIAPLPLDPEIEHFIHQLEGNVTSQGVSHGEAEETYQATRIQLNNYHTVFGYQRREVTKHEKISS